MLSAGDLSVQAGHQPLSSGGCRVRGAQLQRLSRSNSQAARVVRTSKRLVFIVNEVWTMKPCA